jgi:hypothetical protein
VNNNAPTKKYRVTDGKRIWYADKVDYDQHTKVLTLDGLSTFVHDPEALKVSPAGAFRESPDGVVEAQRRGAIEF